MTPRQLYYLVKRWEARELRKWAPMASMMALYANAHRDTDKQPEPFTPQDFMPNREPQEQHLISLDDTEGYFRALAEANRG